MSRAEIDLAILAAGAAHDRHLLRVAGYAETGLGAPIGLLVNGATIYGTLASAERAASTIDHMVDVSMRRAIEDAENDEARDSMEASRKKARGLEVQRVKERAAERHATQERALKEAGDGPIDIYALPDELVYEVITASAVPALTLTDVRIFPPGQTTPIEVEVLRVPLRHVAGWWLLPSEDGRSASFQHVA